MRSIRMLALGASALALLVSSCTAGGGSSSPSGSARSASASATSGTEKPKIIVGSANFPESEIVAEIYGIALEAKGFDVQFKLDFGERDLTNDALRAGAIGLMPEYIGSEARQLGAEATSDPAATAANLKAALEPLGLTVLDYAPGADQNGFVVRKETADSLGLKTLSDVAAKASSLKWGLPPECATNQSCGPALKSAYGIDVATIQLVKLAPCSSEMALALNTKKVDVAELCTTQPDIVRFNFVLLQDDKNSQSADNIAPVLRKAVADAGGAALTDALNAVSAKLTTEVLTQLTAKVAIDQENAVDVAKQFLTDNGLM